MASFHYKYVPRHGGTVPASTTQAPAATNAWAKSAASPGFVPKHAVPAPAPAAAAAPAPYPYISMTQPQPQPQLYYAGLPVPEPVKHNFWYGGTKAEVDAQNAAAGGGKPVQLIPQANLASQQYYCREIDGSYTLRTNKEIMETLQPGYWTFANPGGYPYWVRTRAA